MREEIRKAVRQGDEASMEALLKKSARAVRHILGMTYESDGAVRASAARGMAIASRYHAKLVQNIIRRLVWAMNDESGTNALTAPETLHAVAEETPDLLLPVVPDLLRLTATDPGLKEGLSATLRVIRDRCPGHLQRAMAEVLNEQTAPGGPPENGNTGA